MLEGEGQVLTLGSLERLGDSAGFGDVVFDILEKAGGRRGWHVRHTRGFGGGHLVLATQGALELRAANESLAAATIEVLAEVARFTGGAAPVQLPLPLELTGAE